MSAALIRRHVLNVGSGPAHPGKLHPAFRWPHWREVRLDVEPKVQPDILASMVDMRHAVADASFDALWSSHNLEHLPSHEVPLALSEFARVLAPRGFALITCPDVEEIARFIVEHGIDEVAYPSASGPVTPLDMLWGHGPSIEAGFGFMTHRTGFTLSRLARLVLESGFAEVRLSRGRFALWALCLKPGCRLDQLRGDFGRTEQAELLGAEGEGEGEGDARAAAS
ncbi:class I SAM-dependent methyltransferase [Aureimonas sp. AU40]|uniref:class I SAM-dependent methyltransferase n=1 Tax=Aureimonas sp. AU40 TaxID=1637747 RepID=UPI000782F34E|nr:methyltransferase domain-containing protein [Aureimonas sp. AU40]